MWFPALVDAPAAGYLRGGMRAGARMLRWQGLLTLCKGSRRSPEPVHQGARRSACVRTLKERNAEGRALVTFPSGCLAKGLYARRTCAARLVPCKRGQRRRRPLCRPTRREGLPRRATRRCAPCVCACTRGVTRLDWGLLVFSAISDGTQSCLLYTSPSPRDGLLSRMPSSA